MAVISFDDITLKNKVYRRKKITDYLADQEIKDFEELIDLMIEQANLSVLFKNTHDLEKIKADILKSVRERCFCANGELTEFTRDRIYKVYSARFDLEEFYEEYLK